MPNTALEPHTRQGRGIPIKEHDAIRELLASPQTAGTVVSAIVRRQYGPEAYLWDLTTTLLELRDDFSVDVSENVANRWAAMQTLMTTDAFFSRVDAFMAIANALNVGDPFFQVFDPVTPEEAAWAIAEASINREFVPFGYRVTEFVRLSLQQDGMDVGAPRIFDAVFDPDNKRGDVLELLRNIHTSNNSAALESYVDDQLRDLASQLNKVPSLAGLNELLAPEPETRS